MLLLRPHHINCIFFYRGLGYSKKFVTEMNAIVDFLNKNHNSKIKLVTKCDILCSNCPNKQKDDTCITKEKVEELDNNTLQIYDLEEHGEYVFKQIVEDLYKNFDSHKFYKICSLCNWYKDGVCTESIIKEQIIKWSL
jgi:hypothetical protein